MDGKLVVTKSDDLILTAVYEENTLVELNTEPYEAGRLLGNIYVGKVQNIVKNINAAFVEIADHILCYYSLDSNKKHIFLNPKNNEKLCQGDEILVQVEKESVKTKAPTVTSNINLTGKYLVFTALKPGIGISGKIENTKDRIRLKKLVEPFVHDHIGIIVRTNAAEATDDMIRKEALILGEQMEKLLKKAPCLAQFSLVQKAPSDYISEIRDLRDSKITEIITDQTDLYEEMKQYLMIYQPMDLGKLKFFEEDGASLSTVYRLSHQLEKALQERVWLKSGAYLIIQPTEAMIVIDVNTGKSIGKRKSQEHFLKVNLEAAKEIAHQLRLRNLSGIIIVDFIDMESPKSRQILMETLEQYLKKDRIKTTLIDMTRLNLVEITRKKGKKPLHEQIKIKNSKE